jgi:tripartite-type tricarboxylate transporter receptor subunit TctC
MSSSRLRAAAVALCSIVAASSAAAQDPFYKGKRLTLMISFAPGGPTDIEGRLLAKHIAKHIDGQPSIIVQNKDGAGGMVGASYIGEAAPRDGSMFGYLTAAAWRAVIEPEVYRVDFRTYEFLGFQPSNAVTYVRSDLEPGIKQPSDVLKSKSLVAGGLAFDTSKDLLIRLSLDMLGVPYRYVTGYRSSNNARLAVQRGEINLHSETTPGYFAVVEPSMVKTGQVIPIWYDPTYDGVTFSVPKVMEGSPVLTFPEFYRRAKGALPSGILWGAYRANLSTDQSMLRTLVMPPASSQAAVDALRTAIARVNNDKDYAEEALRTIQFVPHYETGADLNARVRKVMTVAPEIRAFVAEYTKAGNK